MISSKRLEELSFQSQNKGMTRQRVADLKKRGIDPDKAEHGAMIVLTPIELAELLEAYTRSASE